MYDSTILISHPSKPLLHKFSDYECLQAKFILLYYKESFPYISNVCN